MNRGSPPCINYLYSIRVLRRSKERAKPRRKRLTGTSKEEKMDVKMESFVLEGLRGILLSLSSLFQKLEQMLPQENRPSSQPQDTDWLFYFFSLLLLVISLAALVYYIFFRRVERGISGGWKSVKKAPPTLYEHEMIVAAISLLLLVILSLGGLYYYFCYKAGCFGDGATMMHGSRKMAMMR